MFTGLIDLTTGKKEMVNHPDHYNVPGKKECIEEMRDKYGDEAVIHFCMLSAYKYQYRAGIKEVKTKEEDLAKAQWYLKYAETLMKLKKV